MAAACYILFSASLNTFYIGVTHDDVNQRLNKHNKHSYGNNRYTAKTNDWEVFLILETSDYSHAIRIERKIKSLKSKTFIWNLKQYPELQLKLMTQTSI